MQQAPLVSSGNGSASTLHGMNNFIGTSLSVVLSAFPAASVCLFVCLSIRPSVCLSACPSKMAC